MMHVENIGGMASSGASSNGNGITIITTIHNGQAHWPDYFANLTDILGPDDHAVIVDDGSVPALMLPTSFSADHRITVLNPGKIGRAAALNLAISHAPTPFIAIQDVDDQSLPARLPAMRDLLARHPENLVFCDALGPNKAPDDEPGKTRIIPASRLYRGNPFHHSALAFHKDLWREAGGYDGGLECCIDLDFYLRVLAQSPHQSFIFYEAGLIRRHKGHDRQYSSLSPKTYHQTALMVRNRYRAKLKPPVWCWAYDMRHWFSAAFAYWHHDMACTATRPIGQKHILALVHLPPPLHGAAAMNERAVHILAKRHRVSLLPLRFSSSIASIGQSSLLKYGRAAFYAFTLLRQVIMDRPDQVYFSFAPSGPAFWRDSLYALILRTLRLPIIFHLHGRGLKALRDRSGLAKQVQKRVFKNQTAIILGKALNAEVAALDCSVAIIGNCVDAPEKSAKFDNPDQTIRPFRILYLSNLIRSKGVDTAITAAGLVKQSLPELHLDIAGAEADIRKTDLNAMLAQAGLLQNSTYHGAVGANEKAALFENCDLFVFPSRYANEAQPLVVLEAMAHGVPIICSNAGTLGDVVKDQKSGYILRDAKDARELATLILKMQENPAARAKMAKAAHETFTAAFHPEIFERALNELFDQQP
ncbi:glycosyltransferase [Thalassospira marina]|uniref:Glycosyl transferase family 1 domain-containing protein n=1 Tax=Thalassospira marina TaxID=2048283 RepID=A0A2N3KZI0_9PROT|nr:glycosyltransferase [Thalassospira marina]PKR55981.1 hypothetical protein COO20_01840 [Thalassospira marina]